MEPNTRFVLGRYQVDLVRRTVADGDTAVDIHWRSFEALRALIKANGEVVEKEKLLETLWPGVTVDESNLHKYVTKLRKALNAGDVGKEYVETVPRIGYRLGVVLRLADEADLPPVRPSFTQREVKSRPAIGGARLSAGLLGMLLVLGAGFWWMHRKSGERAQFDERAYQNGMNLIRDRALPQVRLGTDGLRRLVQENPRLARAWAGLAEASILLEPTSPDAAIEHALHGISIDPECAECHAILGYLLFSTKWKWDEGGRHLSKAISLKPADPQIQLWLAQREAAVGRTRQAVEIMDRIARQFPEASNLGCSRSFPLPS
ncbi:MAG: winged helix-turn-helix domain-containing protein [Bryobacterales bacterium]|nr:winged helix-turn-helix domain-containing protein [Bryobacterales bacterium]